MSIVEKLQKSRIELLDLGLRNSLLNHRKKAKQVRIIDELSNQIYKILVTDFKTMTFLPINGDDSRYEISDDSDEIILTEENEEDNKVKDRHTDTKLQTSYDVQNLQKKLLTIHMDSQTYIEEQGVNILFLALGFMYWFESDNSNEERRAPLILVPVELKRTDVKEKFKLTYAGEDLSENLSLYEKLRTEFNIKLPPYEFDEDFSVQEYFKRCREKIAYMKNWKIEENEITLGFFSFGKFLMYKDLEAENWFNEDESIGNEIINAILSESGFEKEQSIFPEDVFLDDKIKPGELFLVMDADSTQTSAIIDVKNNNHLVIQGPPGTGKSQTISNIIANALGNNKTVLFVSEKMAALEVVKRRLDYVGIGDSALELHSHKTNKKEVLKELHRTLYLGRPETVDYDDKIVELKQYQKELNEYVRTVNTSLPNSSMSFVQALGTIRKIRQKNVELISFGYENMQNWNEENYKRAFLKIEKLSNFLGYIGNPSKHIFFGSLLQEFVPSMKDKLIRLFNDFRKAYTELLESENELLSSLDTKQSENFKDSTRILDSVQTILEVPDFKDLVLDNILWKDSPLEVVRYLETQSAIQKFIITYKGWKIESVQKLELEIILEDLKDFEGKWWKIFSSRYKKRKSEIKSLYRKNKLPSEHKNLVKIVTDFISYSKQLKLKNRLENNVASILNNPEIQENIDWINSLEKAKWYLDVIKKIEDGYLSEKVLENFNSTQINKDHFVRLKDFHEKYKRSKSAILSFLEFSNEIGIDPLSQKSYSEQSQLINKWNLEVESLNQIVTLNQIFNEIIDDDLRFILDVVMDNDPEQVSLIDSFIYTWLNGLIEKEYLANPVLKKFNKIEFENEIEKFIRIDKELKHYNQQKLAAIHYKRIPSLNNSAGQVNIINREINKKRRHMPIRQLMLQAGDAIQALKPVFMMSPMSIATYIPPASIKFDLVVFDEASQVKPVDAFGALLRGKQSVVVGDSKQLPPTSFFDSLSEGEEEDYDYIGDLESILTLFLAKGVNEKMLKWHYRSKHHSLIAFSNYEFYDNKLFIFPSPDNSNDIKGLTFHYHPGTFYDRGKTRTNSEEARIIAEAALHHAKSKPQMTLGIVAFSVAQRDAITFQLENLRKKDLSCEHFFNESENTNEPFFIKNLENVQGDERDVIFISIGYGKTKEGYMAMSFGPLNREGGERRLNVLITRARMNLHIFSNFLDSDIDTERTNSRGVIALKHFLKYAKTSILEQPYNTNKEPDSPFEESVLKDLKNHGIDAEPQVGTAGFFIDIGIIDPQNKGNYILGVECDGASYHSSRSARDRDRLRQEVLEGLGWNIYRIWSTDWFKDSDGEFKRLLEAIEEAKSNNQTSQNNSGSGHSKKKVIKRELHNKQEVLAKSHKVTSYEISKFRIRYANYELHEIPVDILADLIVKIVHIESPIHIDMLIQRCVIAAGLKRAGNRINLAIKNAVSRATRLSLVKRNGSFIWDIDMKVPKIRDRSQLENSSKKIEWIAPEEIQLILLKIILKSFSIPRDELIQNSSFELGYKRTTDNISNVINNEIKRLIRNRIIIDLDNILKLNNAITDKHPLGAY